MIRIAIIEDETIAARNLQRLLSELKIEVTIVAKIESVKEAILRLPKLGLDLILMDIHLSDGSAFQIFENIEIFTPIIFTTAFEEYALRAFKQNSIDYLLKPIGRNDLELAILKYKTQFAKNIQNSNINYEELIDLLEQHKESFKKRFLVQIGKKFLSINTTSIAYFFVENKSSFIKTHDGKTYVLDYSLSQLESNLNPEFFFRINRQFLVSRQSIENIYYHSTSRLKANLNPGSNHTVWISTDKISKIKKWLNK